MPFKVSIKISIQSMMLQRQLKAEGQIFCNMKFNVQHQEQCRSSGREQSEKVDFQLASFTMERRAGLQAGAAEERLRAAAEMAASEKVKNEKNGQKMWFS